MLETYIKDSTETDTICADSLILEWLTRRASIDDNFTIAEMLIHSHEFDETFHLLNVIKQNFKLTDEQYEQLHGYVWYAVFMKTLDTQQKTIAQLDNQQIEQLIWYATNNDTRVTEFCKNILCFFYQICEPIDTSYTMQLRKMKPIATQPNKDNQQVLIKVFPNPAATYSVFEWNLPSQENCLLRISTATGTIIEHHNINSLKGQWLWDTRNLNNGLYFYELFWNGKKIESGKVSVLK